MSRFKSARTIEHGYFQERLSAYLDGELVPHEHEAVKHHLETCPACQWDLDTMGQTLQWTRDLPTLTVPRVFTVPVPVEERSSRRRWNFLPVLQGATALIAMLFVFAMAGDLVLGTLQVGRAPDAALLWEAAPSSIEVTQVVEKAVGELVAADAEPEAEMMVEMTVEGEREVMTTQAEAPMAQAISPTEPVAGGEAMAPAATPRFPGTEGAYKSAEQEVKEEDASEPDADATTVAARAPLPAEEEAVAFGAESALTLTLPAPSPLLTITAPTVVAVATQLALAPTGEQDEATASIWGEPGVNWLRVIEVALGAAFVLLAAATVFFTIERRRAR